MNRKKIIIIGAIVLALIGAALVIWLIFGRDPISDGTTATFDSSDEKTEISASSSAIDLGGYSAGSIIKISTAGEYVVSGTLSDGQIVVEVGDYEKVQIYLNNASLTNPSGSAIYIKNADKTIITLNEATENYLADGSNYTSLDENGRPDATIFSHDDLTINGAGNLTIKANYSGAIESRDDLKITGGNISITAVDKGLFGNNSVEIKVATLNITAGDDAIHSDGDIVIESGTFVIDSGDDGIHANGTLTINDGSITINDSYEGLEATNVIINGGTIDITATDDGINGAGGNDDNSGSTTTNNGRNRQQDQFSKSTGTITIAAATSGNGDGLDSNGTLVVTGGDTLIKIPARTYDYSSVDYETTFTMTGGRIRTLSQNGTYTEITESNVGGNSRPR